MSNFSIILVISLLVNAGFLWYGSVLIKKLFYVSENIADLYLLLRSFQMFLKTMYGMDSYHGEPMIQELMVRVREVSDEVENFRDVFAIALDEELEEELNDTEETPEGSEEKPLFYESS
jgi:hypothetical protein